MRRTVGLLTALLLAVQSLGSGSPKDFDGAIEADELQGTWEAVAAEFRGKDAVFNAPWVWTFRDGKYVVKTPAGTTAGTYRINRTTKPAHLDETPADGRYKGQMQKGIYQVEGDTLRLAFTWLGTDRPEDFDKKSDLLLITLKRVTK
jgi:uncharacterized protein (TIGR03067 family)